MEKLTLVVAFLLLSSIFIQPLTAQSSCPGVKKGAWPELLGVPAKFAREIIQKENRRLTNVPNVLNGSPVTKDLRCNRVRLFVNVLDFVVQTPRVG
ncbi:trypsin inhibitor 1-like [Lycium barbarum]|uniref:trypsin inhibitor 1-like n=1 Tax=Lycium barbarum TaxID=112863 RepID=UPI00293F621A|nr:trypsin inhibitor 1-like [Lycium barbarum]